MNITFKALHESDFPLLLKWLEAPHVKKYWPADRSFSVGGDQDIEWTPELIKAKYSSYACGYKLVDGTEKPIRAYIIYADDRPIGYIQLYNAHDFPRSTKLTDLPEELGAFDIFIGEKECLGTGLGSAAITKFMQTYADNYTHIVVDPDIDNITAIKSYEKAGFQRMSEQKDSNEVWMIWEKDSANDK